MEHTQHDGTRGGRVWLATAARTGQDASQPCPGTTAGQQSAHLSSSWSRAEMKKCMACAFSSTRKDRRPKKCTTPASRQAGRQADEPGGEAGFEDAGGQRHAPCTRTAQKRAALRCLCTHLTRRAAWPAKLRAAAAGRLDRLGQTDLHQQQHSSDWGVSCSHDPAFQPQF